MALLARFAGRVRRNDDGTSLKGDALNERHIKQPRDQLFFSRKARPVNFEPYTLDQYRLVKNVYELGKLQPDLNTDELVAKRKTKDKVKAFSNNLRHVHRSLVPKRPEAVVVPPSKRDKALEFARNIPKPQKQPPSIVVEPVVTPPSRLDQLEARHAHMRALANDIRRQF